MYDILAAVPSLATWPSVQNVLTPNSKSKISFSNCFIRKKNKTISNPRQSCHTLLLPTCFPSPPWNATSYPTAHFTHPNFSDGVDFQICGKNPLVAHHFYPRLSPISCYPTPHLTLCVLCFSSLHEAIHLTFRHSLLFIFMHHLFQSAFSVLHLLSYTYSIFVLRIGFYLLFLFMGYSCLFNSPST